MVAEGANAAEIWGRLMTRQRYGISASVQGLRNVRPLAVPRQPVRGGRRIPPSFVQTYTDFYKSCGSSSAGLKVLEFGAGPVIAYMISALVTISLLLYRIKATTIMLC